ncbi:hypothetical protein [Paenibacillus eucommiae]|uniref:DUF1002 domain-containing protein n=1 Tax=Paenibacillus eucommiae TaxID=1355755 RepID=A0ABS4ISF3_9BACL|nr:hypothetical protein [Paenibacillus eucommiae]MBP1990498.1 hypothetical protein [Paenibacillus eucommiae]
MSDQDSRARAMPLFFHKPTHFVPHSFGKVITVRQTKLRGVLKMNYSLKFKNVALSALLLSAIAAAPVANADNGSKQGNITSAHTITKSDKISTVASTLTLSNPLELAKKYAPDTVSDWEKALEKYNKLIGFSITDLKTSSGLASLKTDKADNLSLSKVDVSVASIATLAAVPASEVNMESLAKKIDKSILSTPVETDGEALQIAGPLGEVTSGTTSGVASGTASVQAVELKEASGELKAFFKAQIELAEAVESQNAAEIKAALAQLLKQYTVQITELEAAKADISDAADGADGTAIAKGVPVEMENVNFKAVQTLSVK